MNDINNPLVGLHTTRALGGGSLRKWLLGRGMDDIRELESRNRCIWRPSYEVSVATIHPITDDYQIAAD